MLPLDQAGHGVSADLDAQAARCHLNQGSGVFRRPAPEAVNPATAEAAVRLYVEGRGAALEASDADIFAFLTHQETTQGPTGDSVGGRGLASLVDSYGYNTGYSLQVNEETVGGKVTPPSPEKLMCPGKPPPTRRAQ